MAWCQGCGASEMVFRSRREHEQAYRAGVRVVWTDTNPHKVAKPASPTHEPAAHLTYWCRS